MIDIPMKSEQPVDRNTVLDINNQFVQQPSDARTVLNINKGRNQGKIQAQNSYPQNTIRNVERANSSYGQQSSHTQDNQYNNIQGAYSTPVVNNNSINNQTVPIVRDIQIPSLRNQIQKGQKVMLENSGKLKGIRASIGWNVNNQNCDVDVSAFMLNNTGKVMGDTWFVFYGQEKSPDSSVQFSLSSTGDREEIKVDLTRLNSGVAKIVFVLTINEAIQKKLNFSMIKDAYIRIIDEENNTEIVSFMMDEYYSNVTSMMIGEMYLHNGVWKFNAIGNGVAKDLAGLCEMYGVNVG